MPKQKHTKHTKHPKQRRKDEAHAKQSLQITCVIALVFLILIQAVWPTVKVPTVVYYIIGGVAFGISGKDVVNYIKGGK